MSGRKKIERDFNTFNEEIEKLAEKETQKIREKIAAVKEQADKVGEDVERAFVRKK